MPRSDKGRQDARAEGGRGDGGGERVLQMQLSEAKCGLNFIGSNFLAGRERAGSGAAAPSSLTAGSAGIPPGRVLV